MPRDEEPIQIRFSEALISPEVAFADFESLADISLENLSATKKWLDVGPLTLAEADNVRSLAGFLSVPETDPLSALIVDVYFKLESLRRALKWTPDGFLNYFIGEWKKKSESERKNAFPEEKAAALAELFRPTELVNLLFKARRIYEGFIPSFVESYTTVDFRPVFSDDLGIRFGLITTVLEIVVREPDETAEVRKVAVQVDLADIGNLERTLARAKKKISSLQEAAKTKENVQLLNPKVALEGEAR
jgi:hypothetical protein